MHLFYLDEPEQRRLFHSFRYTVDQTIYWLHSHPLDKITFGRFCTRTKIEEPIFSTNVRQTLSIYPASDYYRSAYITSNSLHRIYVWIAANEDKFDFINSIIELSDFLHTRIFVKSKSDLISCAWQKEGF